MEHQELVEIARIISDGDKAVLDELTECIADPEAYYWANQERYEERGVDSADEPEQICWLGLVDILEEHVHVCERDCGDEKEDFFYFLSNLSGIKRLRLEIQPEWLDENGCIPGWCEILDEKWLDSRSCAAAIDIDSDSYVLFLCTLDELARLKQLAAQAGRRVEFARKM